MNGPPTTTVFGEYPSEFFFSKSILPHLIRIAVQKKHCFFCIVCLSLLNRGHPPCPTSRRQPIVGTLFNHDCNGTQIRNLSIITSKACTVRWKSHFCGPTHQPQKSEQCQKPDPPLIQVTKSLHSNHCKW